MDNREPIIIVGTGRCGSTVFHHLLSKHSKLAWLPGALCRRFPQKPELQNLFNRGLDYPILGRVWGGNRAGRMLPVLGVPL